jgi:hypothetical protein
MREARRLVVHIQGQPVIEIGIEYVPYLGDNQFQACIPL